MSVILKLYYVVDFFNSSWLLLYIFESIFKYSAVNILNILFKLYTTTGSIALALSYNIFFKKNS